MPMDPTAADDGALLDRAARGERAAFEELFARHRPRLTRAVSLRLDRRLAARVDASDVVQEACLEAFRRLPDYLRQPDLPLDMWLLWLAREQVLMAHRKHLIADKRAVGREVAPLPADSSAAVVRSLTGAGPTPSGLAAAAETAEKLRQALGRLDDDERELILMRHFEQLSNGDVARVLGIHEPAASKRYVRALERLRGILLSMNVVNP
jgi:RNA polymerase sigma-70 factor (ECF subfamily)